MNFLIHMVIKFQKSVNSILIYRLFYIAIFLFWLLQNGSNSLKFLDRMQRMHLKFQIISIIFCAKYRTLKFS